MAAERTGSGLTPTFLIVWAGQVVSLLGSSLTGFGLAIWVFQETGSVTRLALVTLAVTVPGILLAPIAGVYVDRLDRRMVMFTMDAVAGASTLVLA
ncbi:MAG: MFS transporter, partial [Actinobacteria bacterium]